MLYAKSKRGAPKVPRCPDDVFAIWGNVTPHGLRQMMCDAFSIGDAHEGLRLLEANLIMEDYDRRRISKRRVVGMI